MSKRLAPIAAFVFFAGMSTLIAPYVLAIDGNSVAAMPGLPSPQPSPLATYLGVEFVKDSTTAMLSPATVAREPLPTACWRTWTPNRPTTSLSIHVWRMSPFHAGGTTLRFTRTMRRNWAKS